jgi:hypothetical protein
MGTPRWNLNPDAKSLIKEPEFQQRQAAVTHAGAGLTAEYDAKLHQTKNGGETPPFSDQ